MSVCLQQLRNLQKDMAAHKAKVTYCVNEQGHIDAVFIVGAKGIKREYWDSVLSAAEVMREWLHEQYVNMMRPELTTLGYSYRNNQWKKRTTKEGN